MYKNRGLGTENPSQGEFSRLYECFCVCVTNFFFLDDFRAKTFVSQILRFPSAMFMWSSLAQVVDENNEEEASTRLLFAHLLESIISLEFPTIRFALKVGYFLISLILCIIV